MRRAGLLFGVFVLLLAACGKEQSAITSAGVATVEVDARSTPSNLEAIAFFPDSVSAQPGETVRFHSNFRGEPHTVALGTKIGQGLAVFDKLSPKEKESEETPPAIAKLKIPDFFPHFNGPPDFNTLKLGQAAAQPCYLDAGDPPANGPCAQRSQPDYSGKQALYNSGWLADDASFSVKLASDIAPGTYAFMCLVHGPEMRGKIVVVPSSQKAQTAAGVRAAGATQLNKLVAQLQPDVDKANSGSEPGKAQAGVDKGHEMFPAQAAIFVPRDVSIPVGGSVTWKVGFHTISFNAPTEARPVVVKTADGTVELNKKSLLPVRSPAKAPSSGAGGGSKQPPPPPTVDAGKWDGTGFLSSGVLFTEGDYVFYKLTFTKAGTYSYECLIHPDMKGRVKVG